MAMAEAVEVFIGAMREIGVALKFEGCKRSNGVA